MQWIDMHCDTLSVLQKADALKNQDGCPGESLENNSLCVDIGRLRKAGASAQFFACFVNAAEYVDKNAQKERITDVWERAWGEILKMTEYAQKAENSCFHISARREEFAESRADMAPSEPLRGILTVEEGGILNGKRERLEELYRKGVRLMTLTWNYENCLGSPNSRSPSVMKRGLTKFGLETVEQMNKLGILIDVSHLSDGGFWDCIRTSRSPVVASHSNARALCSHPRNLSDEMLHALGEKGGVAGVNFYSAFLRNDRGKERAGIEEIVCHFRHIADKAGEDALALGTDFDGFSAGALPQGISGVQDMWKLWEAMKKAGFTFSQIEKAACRNVRRVICDVWK